MDLKRNLTVEIIFESVNVRSSRADPYGNEFINRNGQLDKNKEIEQS
jgi:hypothetical protein